MFIEIRKRWNLKICHISFLRNISIMNYWYRVKKMRFSENKFWIYLRKKKKENNEVKKLKFIILIYFMHFLQFLFVVKHITFNWKKCILLINSVKTKDSFTQSVMCFILFYSTALNITCISLRNNACIVV